MDLRGKSNKRGSPNEVIEDDNSTWAQAKRSCPASLPTIFEAQLSDFVEAKDLFIKQLIAELQQFPNDTRLMIIATQAPEEIKNKLLFRSIPLNDNNATTTREEVVAESTRRSKYKLHFLNEIDSKIYTNNELKAKNGERLKVAILDVTNSNKVVETGSLSSAQIEFVVLDGASSCKQWWEKTHLNLSTFDQSVLSPRPRGKQKKALIVGNDQSTCLINGVASPQNLKLTDNSSWSTSKTFRLGAKILDKYILTQYGEVEEAVSKPFRVMEQRGQVNKKHHPPREEDEVWRLEGIGRNGKYHNRLSSINIETVGDFLKTYYENGSLHISEVLGMSVSDNKWKGMINHALECVNNVANFKPNFEAQNLVGNEAFHQNLEVGKQKNSSDIGELDISTFFSESMLDFEDKTWDMEETWAVPTNSIN